MPKVVFTASPPAEVQAQMDEHGVVPPITTYIEA
jgi:hypothetical protein